MEIECVFRWFTLSYLDTAGEYTMVSLEKIHLPSSNFWNLEESEGEENGIDWKEMTNHRDWEDFFSVSLDLVQIH